MLYKSKRCDPRPKAREVLLTWARASAYRDRAIEISKTGAPCTRSQCPEFDLLQLHVTIARWLRLNDVCCMRQRRTVINRKTLSTGATLDLSPLSQFVLLIIISGATTTVSIRSCAR